MTEPILIKEPHLTSKSSTSVQVDPYLELIRFNKPTGSILMFWPFAWGLTLAACTTRISLPSYLFLFAKSILGAFIIRSSACTINDIFDRELDAGVERTKNRPLPSGRVSVFNASVYLLLQYIAGILYFSTFNANTFYAALIQLFPLFIIYPILKRVTHWPQAWLGIAMNFGIVVAYAETTAEMHWKLLSIMLCGAWCWTMYYDTIYACQDIRDDIKMGIHSTARLFGSHVSFALRTLAFGLVAMLALAGKMNGQGSSYFVVSVGGTILHLVWQLATVDLEVPASCWTTFKRNGQLGLIVWVGLMLDYLTKLPLRKHPTNRQHLGVAAGPGLDEAEQGG